MQSIEPIDYSYYVLRPGENIENVSAARVIGDCQEPAISDGDTIIINNKLGPSPGDLVIYKNSVWRYQLNNNNAVLSNNYGAFKPDKPVLQGIVTAICKRYGSSS